MALVTRCSNPSCLTLFRVTSAQLQAFGGQVRCGACGSVFDAFPSLTTVADAALRPADGPPVVAAGPAAEVGEPSLTDVAAASGPVPAPVSAPIAEPAPGVVVAPPEIAPPDIAPPVGESAAEPVSPPVADAVHERVVEWTPRAEPLVPEASGLLQVRGERDGSGADEDAAVPNQALIVERIPDSPGMADPCVAPVPDDTAQLSEPTARSEALLETGLPGDVLPDQPPVDRGQPAPEPEPPEPVPAIAPELTDYSVTRGPPPRTPATAGSWRSTWLPVTALLLAGVAAGAWIARDRLPAPLAGLFDGIQRGAMPATPGGLLREHGIAIAVVLSLALFLLLRRYRAAWIAMAVALAVVLSGQLLHGYRAQIAAHYPVTRPALERFCALLQCEVGLPKAAGQLVIEASDLQALDASQPNLIQLSATVRNRASIDVAFPAIEVTLTDAQDNPLARRVLLPEQYLARGPDSRTGLRAGEEFSVKLTLDTTELRPVGYRLYLFYP